jgi:hypothetical protein
LNNSINSSFSAGVWLQRLFVFLVTSLLGALLLLTGALVFLDGDDYKPLFSWVAQTFFDAELQIKGPLRVHVAGGVALSANKVQLQANDGSYFLSADTLSGDVRLREAVFGTLWVRDLAVSNFYLKINETESDSFNREDFTFPPVVIEEAKFEKLVVEYQELAPGTLHRFALSELHFDDVNDSGPVRLQASGVVEGRDFKLQGTFPPVEQALDHETPSPIVVSLIGEELQAHIDGTITDPANGKGMDLKIELTVPEAQEFLEVLGDGIPAVGVLQATARIQGDYAVPRLVELDAHLHRGEEVDLTLTGSVDDMLTGEGMNLHLVAHSDNPVVTSWLLFRKLKAIAAFDFDGVLLEQNNHFYVKQLAAEGKTSAGLVLTASGEGELYDDHHPFSETDSGIDLKFSAPSTLALNLLPIDEVPDLGALAGKLKLIVSRDAIGLYNADIKIGSSKATTTHLQGQIGQLPLQDTAGVSGVDLKVDMKTMDIAALAKLFGYTLEQTAPGHVTTRITGGQNNFSLGETAISIGSKGGALISAKGKADHIVVTDSSVSANAHFAVTASAADLSDFSKLVGADLPRLGAVAINSTLVIKNTELTLDQLKINIGATDQPTIRMNGGIVTRLHKGSTISMSCDVAVGDLAAALTGEPPGYLGRMQGTVDVSDINGSWGVKKFTLKSSDTSIYAVDIGGVYKDLKKNDLIKVDAKLDINDPVGLGQALGIDFSGYSAFRSEGILTASDESISYTSTGAVGRSAGKSVVNGRLVNGKPTFKGSFEVPVLYLSDFGFNPSEEDTGPVKIDPDRPLSGDIFSKQPLDVSFLNTFDLDFEVLIEQLESHHQMSIDSINAHIRLKDGNLQVDPLKFLYDGGTMDVIFGLQAHSTPAFRLQVVADDLKLGPMMAQVQDNVPINGYSNIQVDVTASGRSPHEMASSFGGKIDLGFENARVPRKYIQFLSVDVLGWALSKAFRNDNYTDLNCLVASFEASDGKVNSTVLIADGPNVSLGGNIKLNLRKETMKIVLLPKQKRKLFSSISPVKITGPMRDPKVEAVPAKAAIQEIGAMALVPYVYVPLRLLSSLWSVVDDGDETGQGCTAVKAVSEEAEKELLKAAQPQG